MWIFKPSKICILRKISSHFNVKNICNGMLYIENRKYSATKKLTRHCFTTHDYLSVSISRGGLTRRYCQLSNFQGCWKCNSQIKQNAFFCGHCGIIQAPDKEQDLFQVFNIQQSFDVDSVALGQSFRKLQMVLHPDKFSLKDEKEQMIAAECSSFVNKAYSTLKNPWLRAKYHLGTLGVTLDEATSMDDPEFLMKVMERNEQVAESEDINALEAVTRDNDQDIRQSISNISVHFNGKNIDLLKKCVIELKYYANIAEKIVERKFELST